MHTFHVPVMGVGFTLDTPLKLARYGISSNVSLVDDGLIEQLRCHYAARLGLDVTPIARADPDARAKRITAYLDLIDRETLRQVLVLKCSGFDDPVGIRRYFELLPESSELSQRYRAYQATSQGPERAALEVELRRCVSRGRIEVNIMTKLDRAVDERGEARSEGCSDALAALRGFAQSTLSGSVVLSAGVSPRLASYIATFPDFMPNSEGQFRKQVVLKVSDWRSARIQAELCSRRGVWVSEFRIESGLNCGGHAFPTEGQLLGPILEEFRDKRDALRLATFESYRKALLKQARTPPSEAPPVRVTAQGGLGTHAEDRLLLDHYKVDATGWGTPFLLVPEATSVDPATRLLLAQSTREAVKLGYSSPLGARFWNLVTASSDTRRRQRIENGTPGSPCPKGFCALHFDYGKVPLCAASRLYQKRKLRELPTALDEPMRQKLTERITSPACICFDLGGTLKIEYGIESSADVCICPGPNIVYFDRELTLEQLVGHIYGKQSVAFKTERPHMLINELALYLDYYEEQRSEQGTPLSSTSVVSLQRFAKNLRAGVDYYLRLADSAENPFTALDKAELVGIDTRLQAIAGEVYEASLAGPTPAAVPPEAKLERSSLVNELEVTNAC